MTTLCLTGWQQPYNALANIAPDALHFEYSAYDNIEAAFAALPEAPELAIGWSLGAQVLVRAIAAGHIRPKLLLLLGAPFQFAAAAHFPDGVSAGDRKEFRDNYSSNPAQMLSGFNPYIAMGDRYATRVARALGANRVLWKNGLFWLDELYSTSCSNFDFSTFPKTVIVHGMEDRIIQPLNAQAFAQRLPASELLLWQGCAHAPHLHDPEALRKYKVEYV